MLAVAFLIDVLELNVSNDHERKFKTFKVGTRSLRTVFFSSLVVSMLRYWCEMSRTARAHGSHVSADDKMMSESSTAAVEDDDNDRSSSTEGPDSPGQSSSGSPVPPTMMPPFSPYHGPEEDLPLDLPRYPLRHLFRHCKCTFNVNSHHLLCCNHTHTYISNRRHCEGCAYRYHVTFTSNVTKDGVAVRYCLRVTRRSPQVEPLQEVERQYEDFEFLHHSLTRAAGVSLTGVIVPPLPASPAAEPRTAETRSRRQWGAAAAYVRGDDFLKDSQALSKYLTAVLEHPHFGGSPLIRDFLEHRHPPLRSKLKKGLFSSMLDFRRPQMLLQLAHSSTRGSSKGCGNDTAFAKERNWASAYCAQIREASARLQGVLGAQMRLANQLALLATALTTTVGGREGSNGFYNRLNAGVASCLAQERRGVDAAVASADSALGSYLTFWSSYLEEENAMLSRRANLVNQRDAAAKACSKAKFGEASESSQKQMKEKEDEVAQCARTAKAEMRRFHQRRLTELRDSLVQYTEGQIMCARHAYDELSKSVDKLREFPLPIKGDTTMG